LIGLSGLHLCQWDVIARGVSGATTKCCPKETVNKGGVVVGAVVIGKGLPICVLPTPRCVAVMVKREIGAGRGPNKPKVDLLPVGVCVSPIEELPPYRERLRMHFGYPHSQLNVLAYSSSELGVVSFL
jgi:hypothetical protein